jgi:hypothetical protein
MKAGLWELEIPMNDGKPINTPITGREKYEDREEPMHALAQFYHALNSRALALMEKN